MKTKIANNMTISTIAVGRFVKPTMYQMDSYCQENEMNQDVYTPPMKCRRM